VVTPPVSKARFRPPLGLLGMIGLVATAELALTRHDIEFATSSTSCWRQARQAARRLAPGSEILCLGDSLVKSAVLPRVLEARLGRPACNLALIGGQAPTTYFQLRRALAAGARPSAVVVDFAPHILTTDPHCCMPHWAELATAGECLDLAWSSRDAGFFVETMLGRLLISLRARHEIRENLLGALRGTGLPGRGAMPAFWRNWNFNKGAMVLREQSRFDGIVHPSDAASFFPPRWACEPVNARYLRRFLTLAAAHRIRVYWLLPPLSPELQAGRDWRGLDDLYTRFARAGLARFPNLTVIDGRHSGYDHAAFVDAVHLNGRGAFSLTDDLAVLLAQAPPPGRWMTLPAFRTRPIGVPLEDTLASFVALGRVRE
jgi:hypothetical protein